MPIRMEGEASLNVGEFLEKYKSEGSKPLFAFQLIKEIQKKLNPTELGLQVKGTSKEMIHDFFQAYNTNEAKALERTTDPLQLRSDVMIIYLMIQLG